MLLMLQTRELLLSTSSNLTPTCTRVCSVPQSIPRNNNSFINNPSLNKKYGEFTILNKIKR